MRRITRWPSSFLIVPLLLVVATAITCGDDDESSGDANVSEETSDDSDSSEEGTEPEDTDSEGSANEEIDTSPASGEEYLDVYQQIASNLSDEFEDECVDSFDISELDFSDVEIPEECRDFFGSFAESLDDVEPPDACADLHELLIDALNSLAEGDNDVLEDLLGGEGEGEVSEGIIEASIDCSGL